MKRMLSLFLILCGGAAPAQESAIEPIRLTLYPAAQPTPALKYQFLPELRDLTAGNAALHYDRAALERQSSFPEDSSIWQWLELPPKDLPRDKVRTFLHSYRWVFEELEAAAVCERCDWQMNEGIRKYGVSLLLPEIQHLRNYATLLQLQAHLEIADGHPDKAVHWLRLGFVLARHANDSPLLISALVGTAIGTIMAARVEELIQAPGAPNLYWALTEMPRPFTDLRRAFQSERMMLDNVFPGLRDMTAQAKAGPLTPAQIQAAMDRVSELFLIERSMKPAEVRLLLAVVAAKDYAVGKRSLLAQGWTAEQVEAMPVLQVAFLHAIAEYDRYFDEMRKWQTVPYWEAQPALKKLRLQLEEERTRQGGIGSAALALLLLPAGEKVFLATTRLDRRLAALRCIEALRLHAAAHDGKWPATLEAVTEVPIPLDPLTGKSFEYKREGEKATLYGPPPVGEQPSPNHTIRYELTLKP